MTQQPSATLWFLGAAGTVTGSKFLVRANDEQVLLECGLCQGLKELRLRNWRPAPVEPAAIDAVVLSRAHLERSWAMASSIRSIQEK